MRLGRCSRNGSGLWCDNPVMLNAAISCARNSPANGRHCEPLYLDPIDPRDLPVAIAKAIAEHGWSEIDGEHYCPVHNPADAGEILEVGHVYAPVKDTGWEIRVPPSPFAQPGTVFLLEIRPRSAHSSSDAVPDGPETAPEPVSATDAAADAIAGFLAAWAVDGHPVARDCEITATSHGGTMLALTFPDLNDLLAERAAVRALAPDARDGEDPFYRPGSVYVSENGWFRFTCQTVVAGIALGVEECLKDRQEPRFTKRNVWRSVRAAGCDYEVGPRTGEPIEARGDDDA